MTIQELTDEMNRFVEAMGWYREDSAWPQTPRNIAISLSLEAAEVLEHFQWTCLLYTSPSPRDRTRSRMPSSA